MALMESGPALVLGSRGYLGAKLIASPIYDFTPLQVSKVNAITDLPIFAAQVRKALNGKTGAILVNCIGLRAGTVDKLNLINAYIPAELARITSDFGVHLIHIGSAAEIATPLAGVSSSLPVMARALQYGTSKRAGSTACLNFPMTTVLRVYNVHGLPHQEHSSLHQLCVARDVRICSQSTYVLTNTIRDYVDWQTVVFAVVEAATNGPMGMRDVSSGIGISISEILDEMNDGAAKALTESLRPADLVGPVVGPGAWPAARVANKHELVARLAMEVIACASS